MIHGKAGEACHYDPAKLATPWPAIVCNCPV
jgi:hypothetical protein